MSAIESIIQDYTVGAKRDCYVGGRKIELAERARKELAALRERADGRANGAELELTALRSQLRNWGDVLIAAGEAAGVEMCAADGSMSPELAPTIAALRERAEKAEDTRRGAFGRVVAERDAAQARLTRYEAPGPALLTAEHERHCPMAARGFAANAGMCECSHEERKAAYREQYARCVAAVERVAADLCVTNRDAAVGAKRVLAALTGEAEK